MQIYSVNLVRKKKLRGNDACPKTTPTNGSAAIRNRYYNYSMLPLVFHNKGLVRRLLRPSIICFRGEATGVTFLNRAWRPSPTFSSGCENGDGAAGGKCRLVVTTGESAPTDSVLAVRGNNHYHHTYSCRREVGPALSLLCAYLEPAASPVCRKSLELRAPSRLPEKPHHTRPHTDPNHCKQPSVAPIKKCNLRSSVCHLASSGKQASRQGFHCFA